MISLKKILVPIDIFDGKFEKLVHYGASFGWQNKAEIFLLSVFDDRIIKEISHIAEIYMTSEKIDNTLESIRKSGQSKIEPVIQNMRVKYPKLTIKNDVRFGSADEEIISFAKEKKIDLILVRTHARKRINHLILGSTTEEIIRLAPCPVLVVRNVELKSFDDY